METGTFLQRAALAGACALPLIAVCAVVTGDDADERVPCDGCGEVFFLDELTRGDAGTRWPLFSITPSVRQSLSDRGCVSPRVARQPVSRSGTSSTFSFAAPGSVTA